MNDFGYLRLCAQKRSISNGPAGRTRRHRTPLLSSTALTAFLVAGLFSPWSVRTAEANNECGTAAAVPAGATQVVACGNIVQANTGVTYQEADIQDGSPFSITFSNTQVNSGGVLLQTSDSSKPFTITIQDAGGGAPLPNIVNGTGSDAALDASTGGANSGITLNLNAGSVTGSGGSRQGIQLTTNGANSAINLTTATGTTVNSTSDTGIELETNGGSNITATVNGSTTGDSTHAGLSGEVDGGSGFVNLNVIGSATGGLFGMVSDASGGGNATSTVTGSATGNGSAFGVGTGTGAAAFTSNGGTATVNVGPAGISTGTLSGATAVAQDDGNAVIEIGSALPGSVGTVSQTAPTAGVVPILPTGAFATADDGNATITAHQGSTVTQVGSTSSALGFLPITKGIGMLALTTGSGNAAATANGTVNATGIGVASLALGSGDATTNVGGNISVTGGTGVSPLGALSLGAFDLTVGAMAASTSGVATLNIHGGNILGSTPDIGGLAVVLGGTEDANIDVGEGIVQASTINANEIGLLAINLGTGDANVDIDYLDPEDDGNIIQSDGIGIAALALGGGDADVEARNSTIDSTGTGILAGGTNVYVDANDVTSQNASGILAFGDRVDIDVHGDVKGAGGLLTATVAGISSGTFSVEVNEGASLTNNVGLAGSAVSAASGGGINVINDGSIIGNMTLFSTSGNNYVENNSNNSWNWAGFNTFITLGGDNIFENNGTSTAGPLSLTTFASSGDSIINNNLGATFNANGLNGFLFLAGGDSSFNNAGTFNVTNPGGISVAGFIGLDDYNNSGVTNMVDEDTFDAIITTGNFNDNGGSLRFDAELTPGGFADLLIVGGDATGVTKLSVNDLDGGPGAYTGNDDAIVFALVGGNTDPSNFTTNGGINKGFFTYNAYLRDTPQEPLNILGFNEWVLASVEGQRSFELPVIAYGAQQMWQTSTGAWSDRTADLRSAFGGTGFGGGGADYAEPTAPMAAVGNVTPGIWGRVFGATQSRDFSNTSAAPLGLNGFNAVFDNSFDQDIYGVMAGIDFGRESLSEQGNQAWIFGVFGGYTGSNLSFDNSDTDVDYKAGSIGGYITYLNGGLFVDATIKADFGTMDYSSGGDSGSADYTSVGGVIDAGYRMSMASGWYIEPKATLAYVNTDFDNIEVFGTDVAFNDGDSLRGRLGARLGTSMDRNGTLIEPYVEASVWNEFEGDYSASFFSNGTGFSPGFDADGVYGEVALGTSIVNASNGWSGFARGAVEFGDDSALGFTGNLGVRKSW